MFEKSKKEILKNNINKFLINYFFWINLLVILVILLLGTWFFIRPKYQKVFAESVNPKSDMEEQYLEKSRYLTKIENLISAYDNINETDKEKILKIIPNKAGAEELIREIGLITKKNGLILKSIKTVEVEEEDSSKATYFNQPKEDENEKKLPQGVGTIKIEINLVGTDYFSLKELLKVIESHVRLFDINNISFDPDKEQTDLKITAYYIK